MRSGLRRGALQPRQPCGGTRQRSFIRKFSHVSAVPFKRRWSSLVWASRCPLISADLFSHRAGRSHQSGRVERAGADSSGGRCHAAAGGGVGHGLPAAAGRRLAGRQRDHPRADRAERGAKPHHLAATGGRRAGDEQWRPRAVGQCVCARLWRAGCAGAARRRAHERTRRHGRRVSEQLHHRSDSAHRDHPRQRVGHLRLGRDRRGGARHHTRGQQNTAGLDFGHRRQPQHGHRVGQRQRTGRQHGLAGRGQPLYDAGHSSAKPAADRPAQYGRWLSQHHDEWLHRANPGAGANAGPARLPRRRQIYLQQRHAFGPDEARPVSTLQRQPIHEGLEFPSESFSAGNDQRQCPGRQSQPLPDTRATAPLAQYRAIDARLDGDCGSRFTEASHCRQL